jgi:copper oxidase (laccase) domain-containing protein
VHTADCAGVLLHSGVEGPTVVGAAHAGWRGLESGVLGATVAAMRELGAEQVWWRLGPCISPAAYEFGREDLARLAARFGDGVAGTTAAGTPALDLRAGVAAALDAAGAVLDPDAEGHVRCTATDPDCYSWRARGDRGRSAAVTWIGSA